MLPHTHRRLHNVPFGPDSLLMKVFYAWQSDTDSKTNRYLIRDCALEAIKQLNADLTLEDSISFDSDTMDVPGSPAIADTIMAKIAACDVFIADLTFVAKSAGDKYCPNPNVLIELGYSYGTIGPDRIIGIMNIAYGEPNELPFDLAHRRYPIRYMLPIGAGKSDRERTKAAITAQLREAIKGVIRSRLADTTLDSVRTEHAVPMPYSSFLADNQVFARIEHPSFEPGEEAEVKWKNGPQAYIRFRSIVASEEFTRVHLLKKLSESPILEPFGRFRGTWTSLNDFGAVVFNTDGRAEQQTSAKCLSQLFLTGEIWGINQTLFGNDAQRGPYIAGETMEEQFTQALRNYIAFCSMHLQVGHPYKVVAGIDGIKNIRLAYADTFGVTRFSRPCIVDHTGTTAEIADPEEDSRAVLNTFFTKLYDSCGIEYAVR